MEERFAVTAATGALGPVLVKLAALLGDEYKLQEKTRRGIESIKSKLEPVHHLLGKLWGREDLDVACKDWMTEARYLSYRMQVGIDLFTLGLEDGFIQLETTDDHPLFEELFMERLNDLWKQCGKMHKCRIESAIEMEERFTKCRIESAIEMEERFTMVTAATGALGPVLVKLAALLGDEYKLQEGTRRGVESIKSELELVHNLLGKLWGREDLDVACKDWMADARELSYDMEDGIDHFTLGLERGDGGFIQLEATDSPFEEFMERVKDVSKRGGKMQEIDDAIICKRSKVTTDPRAHFLHKDASELEGMEEREKEVIQLLQEHEMVCILGFAGMGKTTLADLVYQAVGNKFQCRAFVSVHPSPNMTEILGAILSQVTDSAMSAGSGTEPAAEQNMVTDISISLSEKSGTDPAAEQIDFIKGISNFLYGKRYLVILDDIWDWEEWKVIRKALPKNYYLGCKLIMTTRVRSIAEKCHTREQGARVYKQEFGRVEAERLSAMRLIRPGAMCRYVRICAKIVQGMSTRIADMCGGGPPFDFCPLAVICLSSAWVESLQHLSAMGREPASTLINHGKFDSWASHHVQVDDAEWDTWEWDDGFLSTPSLKPLVQSLCLGFDHLPLQLRTCLLYCTIYHSRYTFDKGCMVRKWVAEGFVSQVEVAEAYFDKLVSRSLLQQNREIYLVHPIMRAFLVCKAKEDKFIAYSSHAKQIRRLSVSTNRCPDKDVLSHTRSLVVSGHQCQLDGVPFKAFKMLRVLEIRNSSCRENGHLVDICGLIWLKYLDLMGCDGITELPREIGRLQNLETLYVAGTRISKLPTEIGKLQHLETLDVSDTKITELPTWIEKLQSLKTLDVSRTKVTELPREIKNLERLETLDVSRTEVTELPTWIEKLQSLKTLYVSWTWVRELPKEIGKLQHLRTLDIRGTKVRELSCSRDPNPLLSVVVDEHKYRSEKLMSPLGLISPSGGEEVIIFSSEAKCRDDLSILILFNHFGERCEVLPVQMLRVAGRHMKVPQWVKQNLCNVCSLDIRLCKLVEEDLEFLKTQMPNLQALQLRFEVLPREPAAITGGGFSKLETFYVDCRLPRVITFGEGAMPKLKHLEFKFYTGTASRDYYYMGIKHLNSLEVVVFRCSDCYTSDGPGIRETIDVLRKEAVEHPNKITLWVYDMEPEVFGSGATWISLADKAIIEFEQQEKVIEERERRIAELREYEQGLQLSKAAEEQAQRDKNNARAGIEKEIQERKSNLEIRERRLRVAERYYNIS